MKMHTSPVLCSIILVFFSVLAGCAPQSEPIDLEAEKSAILEADRAWSETLKGMDENDLYVPDAFGSFFAKDARLLLPGAPLAVGNKEIGQALSKLSTAPGFSMTWDATMADVSSSGDLGYSVGTFELTLNDSEGNPVTRKGKYTTVWQKQTDGRWKVVSDTPNFDSPAAGEGE